MKAEKILLPNAKKRLFLWKNFNPRDTKDIEKVLNSLKNCPPNSFRDAWRWFHLFQETSNAVTEVQNLLELKTLRVANEPVFQQELQEFESNIFRRLLESRQELMDVYMSSPFRSSMHPDDNGRIMEEFRVREPFVKPELATLQVEENNLIREYRSYIYNSRVDYDGRSLSLSTVVGKLSSTEEHIRKSAFITVGKFYQKNATTLERLFSELLENRNAQAEVCSLGSYAPIAFADLGRFDYGVEECATFRKGIEKELSQKFGDIEAAQCHSLGQTSIKPWNINTFPSLIPQSPPCGGNIRKILASLPQLLQNIHPCFEQLCQEMIQRNLVDVFPRHGKGPGAFCMTFPESQMPFIFANLGGSWKDVLTLIHEFGHAAHGHACVTLPNVLLVHTPI